MTAEPTEGRPVAAWMHVLETIDEALALRLREVQEPAAAAAEPSAAGRAALEALDGRLTQLQKRLTQAESDAAEADVVLQTEADAYQHWTESMTSARRRLADWAAGVK